MHYDKMVEMADMLVTYKYVVRNVSKMMGKIATLCPNLFLEITEAECTCIRVFGIKEKICFMTPKKIMPKYQNTCRHYIGGMLKHGRALSAILSPTTNSYKRLVPGYEAPIYLAWSKRNRSAAIRIPTYHGGEKAKRIEYRSPDPIQLTPILHLLRCLWQVWIWN